MIHLKNVSLAAGSFRLQNINFVIPSGQYGILMGRTGSGKTTILEAVCGLRTVESGEILLGDREVTRLKPAERGIGFVPQDGALFPTMKIREQLAFALAIRRVPTKTVQARVDEVASMLGIEHLLDRNIHGLSGGERQRVALGRALAFRPTVLCLDEPLSALDESTRGEMCDLLKQVTRKVGVTTLHITHSQVEAQRLADLCFRLEDGQVESLETTSASVPNGS